jgi:hypothetical protein
MVALIVLVSPGAWALDGRAKGGISAEAPACPIGVYVTSLRDLDPVGASFGIDFWVWSVHRPGNDPLDSLEFVNAKQIETRLERTTKRGDREWPRLKARATVLHDWDVTDFPFDRQTLRVDLGISGSDAPVCGVDRAGSGYDKGIAPEGWRIAAFDVEWHIRENATDFGDPARSVRSAQEHVLVTVAVQRARIGRYRTGALPTFALTASSRNVRLRVGLLLDHRLGRLWGGYGVRVPMHDLPGTLFGPEDARDTQSHGANILTAANLGPVALHLHDIGELGGNVLRHVFEAYDLAVPVVGCGPLRGPSGLIPSAHGRAEGVGEAYVVSMGVDLLEGLGVAIDELAQSLVISLDEFVYIVDSGHLKITSVVQGPCPSPRTLSLSTSHAIHRSALKVFYSIT